MRPIRFATLWLTGLAGLFFSGCTYFATVEGVDSRSVCHELEKAVTAETGQTLAVVPNTDVRKEWSAPLGLGTMRL